jgi:hypothetical protein
MPNPFNRAEAVCFISIRREGVLEQLKLRLSGLLIIYADYIEAPLTRRGRVTQVIAGYGGQGAAFVAVHGGFGGFHVASGAGLDLDEAKHVFVPTDQVNFSTAMRRTEIAGHHDVAMSAKVEVGVFFAAASGALV